MKKFTAFMFIAFFVVVGLAYKAQPKTDAQRVILATQKPSTATKQPTPTTDYQKTAIAAQSTADEARRVNAGATAVYLQSQIQAAQITAAVEQREHERLSWTVTAAGTSIPLTATAQVSQSTAIAAGITATAQAPAIMRDMKSAEAYNARADFFVNWVAKFSLAVFMVAIPAVLYIVPRKSQVVVAPPAPVMIGDLLPIPELPAANAVTERTGSFPKIEKTVIPLLPEQFDNFARGAILERKEIEQSSFDFTEREWVLLKNFMQLNQWTQSSGRATLMLSARGEGVFMEWIENGILPVEYKFAEVTHDA